MKLSIIIPCYNEEKTISTVLNNIIKININGSKEIVIVNDGSTDRTKQIIEEDWSDNPAINIINHKSNKGKGASIKSGLKIVSGDIMIIQDADLEYNPENYNKLIEPIIKKNATVVYGSRFINYKPKNLFSVIQLKTNQVLTWLSNLSNNLKLTDMETGHKAFHKEVYSKLALQEPGFGIEPELTAKCCKLNATIIEVPINYKGRSYKEGKKINWKDGFHAIWCIFKYNRKN